ncbi:MAG: potassium channel family protein [Bacteroidota bacterium]
MSIFTKLVNIKILATRKLMLRHSIILFSLNFILVFIIGLVPDSTIIPELYSITVSGIFFAAVISISDRHIRYLYFAVILTVFTWVTTYLKFSIIVHINSLITIIFLLYIIVVSVIRISKSRQVGDLEFLRAINIYFLIGIAGGIIFRALYTINPKSVNVSGNNILDTTDLLYFSFETITTLGYGDVTPASAIAKSVAIFLSFVGQLYLTMIIALLMGKYLRGTISPDKNKPKTPQPTKGNVNPK